MTKQTAKAEFQVTNWDEKPYLELAQKYRATHSMLVPVQYQRFMAFPDFDRYDLSSFRVKTANGVCSKLT